MMTAAAPVLELFACPSYGRMTVTACVRRHGIANGGGWKPGSSPDVHRCVGCQLGEQHRSTGRLAHGLHAQAVTIAPRSGAEGSAMPKRKGEPRPCSGCGVSWTPADGRQKRCEACKAAPPETKQVAPAPLAQAPQSSRPAAMRKADDDRSADAVLCTVAEALGFVVAARSERVVVLMQKETQ